MNVFLNVKDWKRKMRFRMLQKKNLFSFVLMYRFAFFLHSIENKFIASKCNEMKSQNRSAPQPKSFWFLQSILTSWALPFFLSLFISPYVCVIVFLCDLGDEKQDLWRQICYSFGFLLLLLLMLFVCCILDGNKWSWHDDGTISKQYTNCELQIL